jgi:hypothetical protein
LNSVPRGDPIVALGEGIVGAGGIFSGKNNSANFDFSLLLLLLLLPFASPSSDFGTVRGGSLSGPVKLLLALFEAVVIPNSLSSALS